MEDGLYEQLITEKVYAELSNSEKEKIISPIDKCYSPEILSSYVSIVLKNVLQNISNGETGLKNEIDLVNKVISVIRNESGSLEIDESKVTPNELLALFDKRNPMLESNSVSTLPRPETSISHTSLFTGSDNEPQMYQELKKEIVSSDRIDMIVSFIKWSGLRLLKNELESFVKRGGKLRVLTTTYMGATDPKAIQFLSELPNTLIKISYDTTRTRLHAKSYLFYRNSGFSVGYIGSSNLSNAAVTSGLEWNLKITMYDLPETIEKVSVTFESYWNSSEFENYDNTQYDRLVKSIKTARKMGTLNEDMPIFTTDVRPYSYQQEILDKLLAERNIRGHKHNLVVAATGTGKTVIAALDYKRYRESHRDNPCRLLFVAHREEILSQSLYTFRAVLKDNNFGEKLVGGFHPEDKKYLFISIQSFNSQDFFEETEANFYDYIVVDEFHHAAAPSYQKLLSYYKPDVLLGLTATPERMDGADILKYFDNRIAAEIRLPEAIERKLLCPFQYFGISDDVDLSDFRWSRGGYRTDDLNRVYVFSRAVAEKRADWIIESICRYVDDIEDMKGLGFCVSVEHADFMSNYFNAHGIPSISLTGQSTREDRTSAKEKLVSGTIKVIFVVDIYNEGVDIPEVNTVLFLRPTESLTVFIQQLGRGLRICENKGCLTVLDFIGQAHKKYNFEEKFQALLIKTDHSIKKEIEKGFVSTPKGCYIQLEKMAKEYVLRNIVSATGTKAGIISRIKTFEDDTGLDLTICNFIGYYHLDIRSIYKFGSFSRLCVLAGVINEFDEPLERAMDNAWSKLCSIDSRKWIRFLINNLPSISAIDLSDLSQNDKRYLKMFLITIYGSDEEKWNTDQFYKRLQDISDSPVLCKEIIDLFNYNYEKIDFIDENVDLGFSCPLDLYCTYSRDQIFTAFDVDKPSTIREGVRWLKEQKTDVFLITLNKSEKEYSESTRYNDYSISNNLFHWQSQSTTADTSSTGQRYIHHTEMGNNILLFVREYKKNNVDGSACPYTYLGKAKYVSYSGSKPMNIIWKLEKPIPAKYINITNKMVVN